MPLCPGSTILRLMIYLRKISFFACVTGVLLTACYQPSEPVSPSLPKPSEAISTEQKSVTKQFTINECRLSWCAARVSYYGAGDGTQGRKTANGDTFKPDAFTVAHKTLPFGTVLRFRNPKNGEEVVARVNDRGPNLANRDFDLSVGAAKQIGLISKGVEVVDVRVEG